MDNATKLGERMNDATNPVKSSERERKQQLPSYRGNNGLVICELCGRNKKKLHKCSPTNNGYRPSDNDSGNPLNEFRGRPDLTEETAGGSGFKRQDAERYVKKLIKVI